ncbi:MAG: LysR family transcriptional regulator [Xanthobacteraceae bacterium]|nr:LysR family transcriptional regulator [Xanthobacteraceae bacterium]MBX3550800.1 LysR family transcriptional regulator [Xanthobacteraceae bacterium]MCW5675548.1 LysR family transcriptional regulator [Xanthobacteraceae bacterium]MCW5676464.1 LysR family transcriptional regulator [Xanthobacteraceae bacterium]
MRKATAVLHNPRMFEWSDLRYFLAVAEYGSTLAAGRALKKSQSTVQRRIVELERKLGRELVKRHATGYQLTEFGQQLLPFAREVERAVLALEQQKETLVRGETGVIRLTCPEPILFRIRQSRILDRFHEKHPSLKVEFAMSDKYLDIGKGDADVALRSGDTEDGVLVGRKIADSLWAVYASKGYIQNHGKPDSITVLHDHALIGLDETMAKHRLSTWLNEVAPGAQFAARTNSVLGLVAAAKSDTGVAALPTALGDAEPDLVRVFGPVPELSRAWRLLTHPDLRKTPRISALFDFVNEEISEWRKILTG